VRVIVSVEVVAGYGGLGVGSWYLVFKGFEVLEKAFEVLEKRIEGVV
jgi:hypothetical protein